jgi:ABC-type multidrug transport system ATPase subunit
VFEGRRRKVALDNLCLEIRHGETLGLLGPNGAGKSTAFKIMAGLTQATSGASTSARSLLTKAGKHFVHFLGEAVLSIARRGVAFVTPRAQLHRKS